MLKGITFNGKNVAARDHGALFNGILSDGTVRGCAVSVFGSDVTLGEGYLIACGRLINVTSAETVSVSDTSGFTRVKMVLNTSGTITLATENAPSIAELPALSQDDINDTASDYEVEIAILDIGESGIESLVRSIGQAKNSTAQTVTIQASDWSGGQAVIHVQGVTTESNIIVSPAPSSFLTYADALIRATAQGTGTITFTADSAPSADVSVNVMIAG